MLNLYYKIKKYFNDNNTIVRKFLVNQVAASLLGIMITWPVTIFASRNPQLGILPTLAALLFCGGFFCFLIYDIFYEEGSGDYIRIEHKNMPYDPYKAFRLSVFAYSPTILLALLGVTFFVLGYGNGFAVISILLNVAIHAMYLGLFALLPARFAVIAFPVSILITVSAAAFAYSLGVHDKTLRGILGFPVKANKE